MTTANILAKISMYIAAAALLVVVVFIGFTFPDSAVNDNHQGVALNAMWTFGVASLCGVLGAIGLLFAVGAFFRRERLTLGILALVLNLPVPVLALVILLRNLTK